MVDAALIFANGSINDGSFVQRTLQTLRDPLVVAADGGARMALERFQIVPHVVIGDLDSLDDAYVEQLRARGTIIQAHPPAKDETDLELALKWTAAQEGIQQIRVIGALGRRLDQTFGNVYLLALPELAKLDVQLIAANQAIWLLAPGHHPITGTSGDTISLIPLNGDVHNVYTENLHYPLRGETLHLGPARGISNVLEKSPGTVRFDKGLLLIVHTLGRAE